VNVCDVIFCYLERKRYITFSSFFRENFSVV